MISYIDRVNLSFVAPDLMRELRVGPAEMGAVLSAFRLSRQVTPVCVGWGALLRNRSVLGLSLGHAALLFNLYFFLSWLPTFPIQQHHLTVRPPAWRCWGRGPMSGCCATGRGSLPRVTARMVSAEATPGICPGATPSRSAVSVAWMACTEAAKGWWGGRGGAGRKIFFF